MLSVRAVYVLGQRHLIFEEEKTFSRRASAAGGSLLPLSPGRTQVRLRPLLYQVSGPRQICFRRRRRPSSQEYRLHLKQPAPRVNRAGPLYLNPQPVSFLAALPGLLPRRSASASLSARKICPAYFFDRNRTSKNSGSSPKPRLAAAAQENQLTNRLT